MGHEMQAKDIRCILRRPPVAGPSRACSSLRLSRRLWLTTEIPQTAFRKFWGGGLFLRPAALFIGYGTSISGGRPYSSVVYDNQGILLLKGVIFSNSFLRLLPARQSQQHLEYLFQRSSGFGRTCYGKLHSTNVYILLAMVFYNSRFYTLSALMPFSSPPVSIIVFAQGKTLIFFFISGKVFDQ